MAVTVSKKLGTVDTLTVTASKQLLLKKKIDFSSYFFRLVQRSALDLVTTYGCRLAVLMYIVKDIYILEIRNYTLIKLESLNRNIVDNIDLF